MPSTWILICGSMSDGECICFYIILSGILAVQYMYVIRRLSRRRKPSDAKGSNPPLTVCICGFAEND